MNKLRGNPKVTTKKKKITVAACIGFIGALSTVLFSGLGTELVMRIVPDNGLNSVYTYAVQHGDLTINQAGQNETYPIAVNESPEYVTTQELFFPILVDVQEKQVVGDWIFFIHEVTGSYLYDHSWPALFRMKNDGNYGPAYQVSEKAVFIWDVVDGSVFYMDSTTMFPDHGFLFVTRPDGRNYRLLAESLRNFRIVNGYIYFRYRHTTLGVGRDGHAIYRMDIDGSNQIIVAYPPSGVGLYSVNEFSLLRIEQGWIYAGNFRMELGYPATGLERIQVLCDSTDRHLNGWIYYITTRLMMARYDGSEQMEVYYREGFWGGVFYVNDYWIYFYDYQYGIPVSYRICKAGIGSEIVGKERYQEIREHFIVGGNNG